MRPALPEPAVEDRRRAAAAALYMSITTTDDAQAPPGEELGLYDDPYYEDAYYDEVAYGYDDANPYNEAEVPRNPNTVPTPTLRHCTTAPIHQCTNAPVHHCRLQPRARR